MISLQCVKPILDSKNNMLQKLPVRASIPLEDLITLSLELMLGTENLKSTNLDGGKKECTSVGERAIIRNQQILQLQNLKLVIGRGS